MKRLGLLDENAVLSPMDPDHAVHVMAWMWSQRGQNHWGPVKRLLRRMAREAKAAVHPNGSRPPKSGKAA